MASSLVASKLHMRGRRSLVKSLQKVDTYIHRHVGTKVVPAVGQALRKEENDEKTGHKSLLALQTERQEQAERSVLINCHSRINGKTFLKYLSRHGKVNKHFFYESHGLYALVEFDKRESVTSLSEEAVIPSISHKAIVPFKSRLLSLRSIGLADSSKQRSNHQLQPQTSIPVNQVIQRLSMEESIDQQMTSLTEAYQLTEANSRLRFLVCSLLKDITAAIFPECTIRLFGSSVNGFGKLGSDLDLSLDLDGIIGRNAKTPKSGLSLEYLLKSANSERDVTQTILSIIGECLNQFVPGCVGVQKILNARCPLIRFSHQPSGFQCDLTASNRVAIKTTELLYLYGVLDPRVRHLVFAVRCWGRVHSITSSISGAWITNFSLTVMVLFFLQRTSPPIIPTLDHLKNLAGPSDNSVIEGNDCTFASDLSKIQLQSNTETLEQLLVEFFDFYSVFAFNKKSLNIRTGKVQVKPEITPLHIQNPFETTLNISQNVNASQLDRFVALCQDCSWLLQQDETKTPKLDNKGNNPTPWGLASLLMTSQVALIRSRNRRRDQTIKDKVTSLLESLKTPQANENGDSQENKLL